MPWHAQILVCMRKRLYPMAETQEILEEESYSGNSRKLHKIESVGQKLNKTSFV